MTTQVKRDGSDDLHRRKTEPVENYPTPMNTVDIEPTMLWRGKNVNDMTKPELIQALKEMSELYEQSRKQHIQVLLNISGDQDD